MTASDLNNRYAEYHAHATEETLNSLFRGCQEYARQIAWRYRDLGVDDLVSDIVVAAWEALSTVRNPLTFTSWFRRLANNKIADAIRSKKPIPEDAPPPPDNSDGYLELDLTRIDSLTKADRDLLIRFYHRPNFEAIARELGISPLAVQRRLQRIKNKCDAERSKSTVPTT